MKAKEYTARFNNSENPMEELRKIGYDFIMETKELAKARHIESNSALISIFKELELKWVAFANSVEDVRLDGFSVLIEMKMPKLYTMLVDAGWRPKNLGELERTTEFLN